LRVFLLGRPAQATISEADDADDDENDADDRGRFHLACIYSGRRPWIN